MKNIIEKAKALATKLHKNQKRKNGRPYIEHPREVAEILKKWNQDNEVIAAGWLHDVVEDCNITLNEIKEKFGNRVALLVDGMSWEIKNGKKDIGATYTKFAAFSNKDPSIILIKAADMLSNIPMLKAENRDFVINKSYPRNKSFYLPLFHSIDLREEASKIEKEYNKIIKKNIKSVLSDYFTNREINKIKQKLKLLKPIIQKQKYKFRVYSKKYPSLFAREKAKLIKIMPKNAGIEHIGSTSVPELGGKGIIDIAIPISRRDVKIILSKLEKLGFECRLNHPADDRRIFMQKIIKRNGKERRVHIHLCTNKKFYCSFITFRDYLKKHSEAKEKYAEIKRLAVKYAKGDGKKYRFYKEKLIENLQKKAIAECRGTK